MNVEPGSRLPWYPLPRAWRAHAAATPGSVLLETAGGEGEDHHSFLFTAPEEILTAHDVTELTSLLRRIDAAARSGLHAAGCFTYEAGLALHGIPTTHQPSQLATIGFYRDPLRFDHHTDQLSGPAIKLTEAPAGLATESLLTDPRLSIDRAAYDAAFAAIHRLLAAGDTYQVNFTQQMHWKLQGSPFDLYERLIEAQPVDYASIVNLGGELILSFSPELFFRRDGSRIAMRPMKGTAARADNPDADLQRRTWLAADEKNHAEHLMIVDLLRNDLGRICRAGTIALPQLFHVETYPTLHQMTSTITGELRDETAFAEVFPALFPSGSITGAPKRRTMQIIDELEHAPRGVYTGAIGFVSPTNEACFSVPIRTFALRGEEVSLGIGGGIVADSTADAEYDECRLKAAFAQAAEAPLRLIETLLCDQQTFPLLTLHLDRLQASAKALSFTADRENITRQLHQHASSTSGATRVRLQLSSDGTAHITSAALSGPTANLNVRISARRLLSMDPKLQHKTSRRLLYDRELRLAQLDGFDEVLFLNERDELAEGAISTLFLRTGDTLYTPPLTAGVLPGTLRTHLLQTRADLKEKPLRLEDLSSADAAYVGNALRGLRSIGRFKLE